MRCESVYDKIIVSALEEEEGKYCVQKVFLRLHGGLFRAALTANHENEDRNNLSEGRRPQYLRSLESCLYTWIQFTNELPAEEAIWKTLVDVYTFIDRRDILTLRNTPTHY